MGTHQQTMEHISELSCLGARKLVSPINSASSLVEGCSWRQFFPVLLPSGWDKWAAIARRRAWGERYELRKLQGNLWAEEVWVGHEQCQHQVRVVVPLLPNPLHQLCVLIPSRVHWTQFQLFLKVLVTFIKYQYFSTFILLKISSETQKVQLFF